MWSNIFDSHAHYTNSEYDEDRGKLLAGLPEKGVKYVLLASSSVETSRQSFEIATKYSYIYMAAGVHPGCAEETPKGYLKTIEGLARQKKVVAIGEIGLDYHYDNHNKSRQLEIFEEQLVLAKKLKLPVIIHSRDATESTLNMLKRYMPKGVMHCFSASKETAKILIDMGLYISFTGVVTFKNARNSIDVLGSIPLERLLLETDCPYMAPHPFRGQRCDSSMIIHIAQKVAQIHGMDTQKILDITCENAVNLFQIPQ